jgi:hypothetical protein
MIQEGKTGSEVSHLRQSPKLRAARVHEDVIMGKSERRKGGCRASMRDAASYRAVKT